MKFIAARKIPIPTGVDVLLVDQEVVAQDIPVLEQVSLSIYLFSRYYLFPCLIISVLPSVNYLGAKF